VANIKSRDELVGLCYALLCIWFVFKSLSAASFGDKLLALLGIFLSYLLSMFSKEGCITLLVGIPLTMFFFSSAKLKEYIPVVILLAAAAGAYLLARNLVWAEYASYKYPPVPTICNYFYDTDTLTGWATAIMLLGRYLFLLLIPYQLVSDYSYGQLPITTFTDVSTWISLLVYAGLVFYAIRNFKKKNIVAYGILFFVVTMSIYSNLVYRIGSSFAERFLFTPSLGYCIAFVPLLFLLFKVNLRTDDLSWKTKPALFLVVGVICLLYSVQTVVRAAEWKDQYTLFTSDVKKVPNSAGIHNHTGVGYMNKAEIMLFEAEKEKDFDKLKVANGKAVQLYSKALVHFRRACSIYPSYVQINENKAKVFENLGRLTNNEALLDSAEICYENYLEVFYGVEKGTINACDKLAKLCFERGKMESAKHYCLLSIALDSTNAVYYMNLSGCYGVSLQFDSALYFARKSLELNPKFSDAYYSIGVTHAFLGQFEKALNAVDSALLYSPQKGEYYLFRGRVNADLKKYDEAMNDVSQSISYITTLSGAKEAYYTKGKIFEAIHNADSASHYLRLFEQLQ
jgi:tetratricopeptide (TPR) repeat protein